MHFHRGMVALFLTSLMTAAIGAAPPSADAAGPAASPLPCQSNVVNGPPLSSQELTVNGAPFGVVASGDGQLLFVAVGSGPGIPATGALEVVALKGGPHVKYTLDVPANMAGPGLAGAALSPDGSRLFIANGDGVIEVDAHLAAEGSEQAFLKVLQTTNENGTIEVAVSPDDRFVVASEEYSNVVTFFDLTGLVPPTQVPVSATPVGLAFTPGGDAVLVTSEAGALSVIDAHEAESGDANAVASKTAVGCTPVRVAVSPDGSHAWVTARSGDALLGFSLPTLLSDPPVLAGWTTVGPAPVGVALADDGALAVVANSNRFGTQNPPSIDLVDTAAVLNGGTSAGTIVDTAPSGLFPRDVIAVANSPLGAIAAVTDYSSGQVTTLTTEVAMPGA